jgi:hypothetical protein
MRTLPILLAAALLSPAGAAAQQDLRSPDARDASRPALSQDLRSPDTRDITAPPRTLSPTSSLAGTTSPAQEPAGDDGPATWPWLAFAVAIVAAFAATVLRRRKVAAR